RVNGQFKEKHSIIHKKVDLPKIKPYVVEYQWLLSEMRKKEVANYQKVLCQIHLVQELFCEVDRVKENESFKKIAYFLIIKI
ncbi:hypothetical protein WwAna1636, partial [Wolbachia endosymbiont of Drosophila ananassae]